MSESDLVEVRLIGIPLSIHRLASEHQDGLNREFAFLARQADADPTGIPARLLTLSRELRENFQSFSSGPAAALEEALKRGEEQMDLLFLVPPAFAGAARLLAGLLEEADAYCLTGKDLLTLVAPGHVVTYRNWFLDEFVRQINGEQPRPWSAVQQSA
ncbi:MAG: hypothetical protein WD627_07975 [Actinomycetota bacterium]